MTNELGTDYPTWTSVALRVGEELAANGPNGYYNFTPTEWRDWALSEIRALKAEARYTKEEKDTLMKERDDAIRALRVDRASYLVSELDSEFDWRAEIRVRC